MADNFQNENQYQDTREQNQVALASNFEIPQEKQNKVLIILPLVAIVLVVIGTVAWFIFFKKPSAKVLSQNITTNQNIQSVANKQVTEDNNKVNTVQTNQNNTNKLGDADGTDANNVADVTTPEEDFIMDNDNDELTNYEEKILGTDPGNTDTDGDGNLDNVEVKNGYNPNGTGRSEIFSENGICKTEYQKLIDEFGQSYADCYGDVSTATCKNENAKNNIALILDASGSMAGKIQGNTKNNIAKEATKVFIEGLDYRNQLSILMYGHKGSNQISGKSESCRGVEEIYNLSTIDKDKAIDISNTLKAIGYTPIAKSLEKLKDVFAAKKGENNIAILISDGGETCGGDPYAVSQTLKAAGIKVNVIGFDVGGSAEDQLKMIAEITSGTYYSARNLEELNQSLTNLSKVTCSEQANAWNDGLNSTLDKTHACFEKINAEAANIGIKSATEMHLDFCLDYIATKYNERERSINDQIERASEESIKAVDRLDPTFDSLDSGE